MVFEADGAHKDSNKNGETVEQAQQLAVKREIPSQSIHATPNRYERQARQTVEFKRYN